MATTAMKPDTATPAPPEKKSRGRKPRIATKQKTGTAFRDGTGHYTWPGVDGSMTSVTTIIGVRDKPAIPRWVGTTIAGYVKAQVERAKRGEIKGAELIAILSDEKHVAGVPYGKKDSAAARGTDLHKYVELWHSTGEITEKDVQGAHEDSRPYIKALARWLAQVELEVEFSETTVLDPVRKWAGTLDMIGRLKLPTDAKKKRYLIDFKTSSGVYAESCLQCAAYMYAPLLGINGDTGETIKMPNCNDSLIVQVTPAGVEVWKWEIKAEDYKAFLVCLDMYHWNRRNRRARSVMKCE